VSSQASQNVAIVDYGLGNLFSVKNACDHAGIRATITYSKEEISNADGVILPGVGAFGDAMDALIKLDLIDLLKDFSLAGKPLIGICLGMQLLMTESYEFGWHEGLGVIEGSVLRLEAPKVPNIGWSQVYRPTAADIDRGGNEESFDSWSGTPMADLQNGEYMYFVHSYYTTPNDPGVLLSTSRYGDLEFCSMLQKNNTFGCQFHPERSGPQGLKFYSNIVSMLSGNEQR